jgi:2-dehydro-3-deoxyphosphogluconate aldolase/(4S)-4-hydroxy-2-oxoglutarate aldolase
MATATLRDQALARIRTGGLLPILRLPASADVLAMAEALIAGGLTVIELSLTMPNVSNLIATLADRFGANVSFGAGTVLTMAEVDTVKLAGASFIVSPITDAEVVQHAKACGLAVFPGALTPTEVIAAWKAGADMVKVFPCHTLGGADYLRALKAPLPQIELLPTGGINRSNAAHYLRAGAAALGMGSDLVDLELLRTQGRLAVVERAREYMTLVQTARAS